MRLLSYVFGIRVGCCSNVVCVLKFVFGCMMRLFCFVFLSWLCLCLVVVIGFIAFGFVGLLILLCVRLICFWDCIVFELVVYVIWTICVITFILIIGIYIVNIVIIHKIKNCSRPNFVFCGSNANDGNEICSFHMLPNVDIMSTFYGVSPSR